MNSVPTPRLIVFSTLFPSVMEPLKGCFIYQRVHRLYNGKGVVVVSPQPWFPFQRLLGRLFNHHRSVNPYEDRFGALQVLRPRFFSLPIVGKWLDPLFMAMASYRTVKQLSKGNGCSLLDAHFAFPDGVAASYLKRWLKLPLVITLRGTEIKHCTHPIKRRLIGSSLIRADAVIGVSNSLLDAMKTQGFGLPHAERIGNGVDTNQFFMSPATGSRSSLGLDETDPLLITVGGLVPRKGQHLIIGMLPNLLNDYPNLHYLIIGGSSGEGDYLQKLRSQAQEVGVDSHVHFLGTLSPDELRPWLNAANLFVLPTSNEGWANVILESMACGTPVVATQVGGNAEVVSDPSTGIIVPYDPESIEAGIREGLERQWDSDSIACFAKNNSWNDRIERLEGLYTEVFRSLEKGTESA
ncbi:glycosyltransferase [Aestuariirhabdus sp. LZHN29]|uniref:glycosyltransferase n=1 Tax=Aestuariirhabdus sp. LZHN29 TaxID=3417462 RepID=UPI003CF60616